MKKLIALIIAVTCLSGTAALARFVQEKKGEQAEATAQLTEIKVCPMSGEEVKGEGAGSEVVGKYKVFFCCSDCKASFNKLSPAEKEKKVMAALKKQEESKKKS